MALPDVSADSTGHITHHNTLHDWTQVDELVRYVSVGVNGNDSNDGLSPFLPKATLQSAYDSLPSPGGLVCPMPGRHNVGSSGLQLTRTKPLGLIGLGNWQRLAGNVATWDTGGGTVVYSGSGTPTSLVSFPNPGTSNNGQGFEFRNIVFEVKSGMSFGINADSVNHAVVDDCLFHMRAPTGVGISIKHPGTLGDDASWWRISDNTCYGGRFFESLESANHNQIKIEGNTCLQGSVASVGTFLTLRGGHRCSIIGNNFEGDTVSPMMKLDDSFGCMTLGNGGEGGGGGGQIFCQLDNSNGNLLMDMGFSSPAATDVLYDHINGSQDNLELTAAYSTATGGYSAATSTVFADSSSNKWNSRVTGGVSLSSSVWMPKVKSGSGSPNSAVVGWVGDLFTRSDGGANTTLYIKESGNNTNTGWVAK